MILSSDDPQILTGNFMGDFVKGRLEDRYPPRIREGLILHRRIDSYAHHDSVYQQSKKRLSPHYGLYRGVLVDIFYDHILVREWRRWSDEPFPDYLARTRSYVDSNYAQLPPRLQQLIPIIFTELLPSYGEIAGIGCALERMARRIKRENPLGGAETELVRNYEGLSSDFERFMIGVREFAADCLAG
jgi:acyl carrier protein phosphodiesterase